MALAPHSVAKRGMSLCALGFVLATPVLYGSVSRRDSHLPVQDQGMGELTNLTVKGT